MLDSLSALVITFAVMSVISLIGVLMLFLAKNEKLQKGFFYFLVIWGLVIAYCNVISTPFYWTGSIFLALALGALSVAGLLVKHCMKHERSFEYAKILESVSVVDVMIDTFMI